MKKFDHITAPYSFREYYSSYPQGFTIYEALLEWLQRINEMIDTLNITVEQYQNIEEFVTTNLEQISEEKLQEMLTDGTLESLINQTIMGHKIDRDEFNEFKRVQKSEVFNVYDYGAKGDNLTDDTVAIQNAINDARLKKGTVFFPEGYFLISAPLRISKNMKIQGVSYTATRIVANSLMRSILLRDESVLQPSDRVSDFEIIELTLDCNYLADYGFHEEQLTYFFGDKMRVMRSLKAGLRISYGWCNDILNSNFLNGRGNGLEFVGSNNNMLNIVNCKVFVHDGVGIWIQGGAGVSIRGCVIEKNKITGINIPVGCRRVNISDNYFEENGDIGLTYTNFSGWNVKADVNVNGKSNNALGKDWPMWNLSLTNNYHRYVNQEALYFINQVEGLVIDQIYCTEDKIPLLLLRPFGTMTNYKDVYIGFTNLSRKYHIFEWTNNYYLDGREFTIEGVDKHRYSPDYTSLVETYAGVGETTLSTMPDIKYKDRPIFKLLSSSSGTQALKGLNIQDIALAGKLVTATVYFKTNLSGLRVRFEIRDPNNLYYRAETTNSTGKWEELNVTGYMDSEGRAKFGVGIVSATTGQFIEIGKIVVAEFGGLN